MRLYLVRHGQTAWNSTNRAQGHTDIDLDETGLEQAALLGEELKGTDIQRILASDLARCIQTVAPFADASGLAIETRKDLRERTFGKMEGSDFSKLHSWMRSEAQRLGIPDWQVRPPGGESMEDVWHRLAVVDEAVRAETADTLVVSHGGALAQFLSRLLLGSHETPRSFRFSNCGITVLAKRPDGAFLLEDFNKTRHLEALIAVRPVS